MTVATVNCKRVGWFVMCETVRAYSIHLSSNQDLWRRFERRFCYLILVLIGGHAFASSACVLQLGLSTAKKRGSARCCCSGGAWKRQMWTKLKFLDVDGRGKAAARNRQELSGMRHSLGKADVDQPLRRRRNCRTSSNKSAVMAANCGSASKMRSSSAIRRARKTV